MLPLLPLCKCILIIKMDKFESIIYRNQINDNELNVASSLNYRTQDQMVFSSPLHAQVVCWSSNKECWSK